MHRETRAARGAVVAKFDKALLAGGAILLGVVALLLEAALPPTLAWIGPSAAFAGFGLFLARLLLQAEPWGRALAQRLPAWAEVAASLALGIIPALLMRDAMLLARVVLLGSVGVAGILALALVADLARVGPRAARIALGLALAGGLVAYLVASPGLFVPLALVVAGLLAVLLRRDDALPLPRASAPDLFLAASFGALVLAAAPGALPAVTAATPAFATAGAALVGAALAAPALLRAKGEAGGAPWLGVGYLLLYALAADIFGPGDVRTTLVGLGGASVFLLRTLASLRALQRVTRPLPVRLLLLALQVVLLVYPFVMGARVHFPDLAWLAPLSRALVPVVLPFQLLAALCVPLLLLFVGWVSAEGMDDLAASGPASARWSLALAWGATLVALALSLVGLTFVGPLANGGPAMQAVLFAAVGGVAAALVCGVLAIAATLGRGRAKAGRRAFYVLMLLTALPWYVAYSGLAYGAYESIPVLTAIVVAWGVLDVAAELPARLAKGRVRAEGGAWGALLMFAFLTPVAFVLRQQYGGGATDLLTGADAWWITGLALGALVLPARRAWRAMRRKESAVEGVTTA